ncbi:hypothetical protein F0562_010845 [Nyssa sinensis]|uniref:Integrase catalytic domain-containing protein n=1 Tax=Nyssa sinensis TaxID=561372 RepID=A0A5J5A4T9_9ASTE|nr:hypothetical protein F0562_010845 [Nyssa sinensis]
MRYQSTYFTPLGEGRSSFSIPFNESNLFCHILFDEKGRTPVSFAASIGYLDGVRYFLDKTPAATYLRDFNRKGFFPIHWASIRGHVKIIDEFLKRCPSSWELLNEECQNILHMAAESGKANVVRYILQMPECESLINERDTDGNTPLHLASKGGQPRVVSILAWDDRVKLGVINHEGLMALDVAVNYTGTVPSFEQRLTWLALRYAGAPQAPWESIRNIEEGESTQIHLGRQPRLHLDNYKDGVNTLLLVATLVVTVTFAAGFTMPGGYTNSDPNQGMATLVHKSSFHVFLISNTIAMYSSILVAIILIWAQWGDLSLVVASLKLALPLLGISLTMVSISFMAGVHLVAMVETETGLKLKCLRSNNGGEYIDGGFKEYCAALGIRMKKTIPRTPQQNRVVEPMNRTMNERARSMRLHAGLPPTFCADADDQGRKIIRSRNVIFNEKIMYKDKSSTVVEATPQESEFVRLDDLLEVTVQCRDVSDGESGFGAPIPIILQSDSKPSTPTAAVRSYHMVISID